jgi:hypothetical protein
MTSPQDSTWWKVAAHTIDKYIAARNKDMLCDVATEEVMSLKGERGQTLYGAMNTLFNHGRISRTMLEQAFCYSETSYSEYIPLWISSLPPGERSMYAAELYNSKYFGIEWEVRLTGNVHRHMISDGAVPEEPPTPIGDNRHDVKMANVARYASGLHKILTYGILFDGNPGDLQARLNPEYVQSLGDDDYLASMGPCFGIDKSELNWDQHAEIRVETMSNSEVMIRTWNLLYFCERLCKTELECALAKGPDAMKDLFSQGVRLANLVLPHTFKANGMASLLNRAKNLDLDDLHFAPVPEEGESHLECDYCGEQISKQKTWTCSSCHFAMYCKRDCQKSDWKRHKPLCARHQQQSG